MIVEWLAGMFYEIQVWFVDLQPAWEPPAFFLDLDSNVSSFFDNFDGLGVWADWAYLALLVGLVLATWVVVLLIKVARAVASYLLPGWGSA